MHPSVVRRRRSSVTPSDETWTEGDREILCTLGLEDDSEVTGSKENTGE